MDKPTILIFKASGPSRFERERVEREAFRATHGNEIGVSVAPWSRRFVQVRCDLIRSGWSPRLNRTLILQSLPYSVGDDDVYFDCTVPVQLSDRFVEAFMKKLSEALILKYEME